MNKVNGFTTLTVTLMLVSILVAVSVFIGKALVSEKRIALNEIEYRVAYATAEKGVAEAVAMIKVDSTVSSVSGTVNSSSAQASYNVDITDSAMAGVIDIISTATLPGGGQTRISMQVAERGILNPDNSGPAAPMMINGTAPLNGNITIVANPNGSGKGVPVSVWSKDTVNIGGNAKTCGMEEYKENGCTTKNSYSYNQGATPVIGADIVANDPGFPSDMFDYVFGEPDSAAAWEHIYAKATAIVSSCSDPLLTGGAGFFIVEGSSGTCTFGTVGSPTSPVILLVKDANVVMNGGSVFHGLLFSYDSDPDNTPDYTLSAAGGATIYGSLLANHDGVKLTGGTFKFIYDEGVICDLSGCVNSSLGTGSSNPFISIDIIPGSWKDW